MLTQAKEAGRASGKSIAEAVANWSAHAPPNEHDFWTHQVINCHGNVGPMFPNLSIAKEKLVSQIFLWNLHIWYFGNRLNLF